MAPTVASMFTTMPFFMPDDSCMPAPITSSVPSGLISATMHAIFDVPMSSPTIKFLFSLFLLIVVPLPPLQTLPPGR